MNTNTPSSVPRGALEAVGCRVRAYQATLARDDSGALFHTYSRFSRGIDALNPVYQALDLVPKGRDEARLAHTMSWVKRRDEC